MWLMSEVVGGCCGNLQLIASWSEAWVTTWTCNWHLSQKASYGSSPLTYWIWCYLQVDKVRIELNYKTLSWYQSIACWLWGNPYPNVLEFSAAPFLRVNKRLSALCAHVSQVFTNNWLTQWPKVQSHFWVYLFADTLETKTQSEVCKYRTDLIF